MSTVRAMHPSPSLVESVQVLGACGASPAVIMRELGLSKEVFNLYYSKEVAIGLDLANARVAKVFFEMASSGDYPTLTLAWMKMRANWKESGSQDSSADAPDIEEARRKLQSLLSRKRT